MNDLLPVDLIRQNNQAANEQARQFLQNTMSLAGDYTEGVKKMAGGSPGVPMKTMAREEMDRNNAMTNAATYMQASGKVPEMDFLKQFGIDNVLGNIAGQKTYDAQQTEQDMAMKWYNATKKGSGSSGNSTTKLTDKEKANNALADAYAGIDDALAQGTNPNTLRQNLYSYEADFTRQGLNMNDIITYLDNKIADSQGKSRGTGDPIKDMILQGNSVNEKKGLWDRIWG